MKRAYGLSAALLLAVVILFATPLTVFSATYTVTGVDAVVTFTYSGLPVLIEDNATVSDTNFADSYIDIRPYQGFASGDKLSIQSDANVNASGSISLSGSTIYQGNGSTRSAVASVDSTYNGQDGTRLRINFSSPFDNGDFSNGFANWTTNNAYIALSGDSGTGITTSISVVTSDGTIVAPSGSGNFVKMSIDGSTNANGTAHGPSLKSASFSAKAGDKVSVKFNAVQTSDKYDVYGYLVKNGVRTQILYERGATTSGWKTVNASITTDGTYQFEFICGSQDATGGEAIGSIMYIDDVRLLPGTANGAMGTHLLKHVTFETTTSTVSTTDRKWYVTAVNATGETVTSSTKGTIRLQLQAPEISSVSQSTNQLTVNYSAIPIAQKYEIWRDGVKLGETSSLSYSDTGRTPNTAYTYKVLAKNSGGSDVASSFSEEFSQYTTANAPTLAVTNRSNQTYNDISIGANGNPTGTYYNLQVATNIAFTGASEIGGWGTGTSRVHSGLAVGTTYYYRAVARNGKGDVTAYSATQSVTVNSSPVLTIGTVPTAYKSTVSGYNTFSLTGTVSDADSDQVTVSATIGGVTKTQTVTAIPSGAAWTLTWNISTDNISEASYTGVLVTSVDDSAKSNASGTGKSWTNVLYVDRSAPATPVISAYTNWTNASTVSISVTNGTDSKTTDSGALKSQYSLSGAITQGWTDYSGFSITTAGSTTIQARTTDKVGNVGASSSATVRIDRTAPNGTNMKLNNDAQYTNSQTVNLNSIAASDTGGSGNKSDPTAPSRSATLPEKMQISNVTSFSIASSWMDYATSYNNWTLSSGNGTKTVYIRFRDSAGNVSSAISDSIIFDSSNPVLQISQPSQYSIKAGDSVSYTINPTEANPALVITGINTSDKSKIQLTGAGNISTRISEIQSAVTIVQSLQTRTVHINLPDDLTEEGSISIQVLADALTDSAGNKSLFTAGNFSFNVDCTPPVNQDELLPANQHRSGGQAVELIKPSANSVGGTEGDSVRFAPDGYDGIQPANGENITSTHGLSSVINAPTEEGTYFLYVLDAAGNISQKSAASLIVKNHGPVVALQSPDVSYVNAGSTVSIMAIYSSDAASIALGPKDVGLLRTGTANAYVRVNDISGAPYKKEVELYNLMGDGTITITIAAGSAVDAIGNPADESAVSELVTVDNISPILSAVTFVSDNTVNKLYAKKGDKLTLSFVSDEALSGASVSIGGEVVKASEQNSEKTQWKAEYTIPSHCTLQDGDFPFSIEAADLTGNFCDAVTKVSAGEGVTYDTLAPLIELNGDFDEINDDYIGDVTLTFNEGTSVLINSTDETTSNPISGSVVSAAGEYKLKVMDSAGNTSTTSFVRSGDLLDVVADSESIGIIYAPGDRYDYVTKNIGLPETGKSGSTVFWELTAGTAVTNTGVVVRPQNIDGNQQITLTATIAKGGASAVRTFNLTVIALPGDTDAEKAQDDGNTACIYYAPDDSADSVTRDLELANGGDYGSVLTWNSDTPGLISIASTAEDGRFVATVIRPTFAEGDKKVILTVMATLGEEIKTRTFELNVKRLEGSDADLLKEDVATVSIAYAGLDSVDYVTQNVTLLFNGSNHSSVQWTSSDLQVIDISKDTGIVFRPSADVGSKQVSITATVTKKDEVEQKEFVLTVICEAGQPDESNRKKMELDLAALQIGFHGTDTANNVCSHLSLPLLGEYGSAIAWSSNNPAIANDGTVLRNDSKDIYVILTATVTNGAASDTKAFMLTVKQKPLTLLEQLGADADAVALGFAEGNSSDMVNQNIVLETMGANECTVTWTSSDPDVIGNDGVYISQETSKTVTLTAAISKEGFVIYRPFIVKAGW